jgi:sporulation protein YlmC with PRC-barrel domain
MKKLLSASIALAFIAAMPVAVPAQTSSSPAKSERATKSERAAKPDRTTWSNTEGLHESNDIVGTRVDDTSGKNVGKIDALLIDPKDGKVSHAVVGLGGVLGVGKEKVVVKWSDLKMGSHDKDGRKMAVAVDRAILDQAPEYSKRHDRGSASPATTRPSDTKARDEKPATTGTEKK